MTLKKKQTESYSFKSFIKDTPILPKTITALINNNIFTIEDLTNHTKKEIKQIKGVSSLGLASIELFFKKIGVLFKKEEKKVDEFLTLKKSLVLKYLKPDVKINWANELRAAQKLIELHPDKEFWHKITLPFKLNSLFFFLSQNGKEYLYPKKVIELPVIKFNKVELEDSKIGDDVISHKPKSIRDFLNES